MVKILLVTQSVKEVLQSLIDNDLVSFDKIGTSNCKSHFYMKKSSVD